jgi:hypothetical protein
VATVQVALLGAAAGDAAGGACAARSLAVEMCEVRGKVLGCGGKEERVATARRAKRMRRGARARLGGLGTGTHGCGEVGGEFRGEDCGRGGGDDVARLDCCEECFSESCGRCVSYMYMYSERGEGRGGYYRVSWRRCRLL